MKDCTKAVTIWFFDDFRSKNGLPASDSNYSISNFLGSRLAIRQRIKIVFVIVSDAAVHEGRRGSRAYVTITNRFEH